uniref:Uncharacterized protein n=1 Tax=Arundo donax TaxID=35708 RepID=A0A0A9FRN5_ARUDO
MAGMPGTATSITRLSSCSPIQVMVLARTTDSDSDWDNPP